MTEQEIIKSINKVEGLSGMTVNECLVVCGLIDEFDKLKKNQQIINAELFLLLVIYPKVAELEEAG